MDAKYDSIGLDYADWLGPVEISPVLVPHDCNDGFLYACWRRPAAYLDPRIRSGSSSFWALDGVEIDMARLTRDLETGEWVRRYFDVLALDSYDAGYRLVVSGRASPLNRLARMLAPIRTLMEYADNPDVLLGNRIEDAMRPHAPTSIGDILVDGGMPEIRKFR